MVNSATVPRAFREGDKISRHQEWGVNLKDFLHDSTLTVSDFDNKALALLDIYFTAGKLLDVLTMLKVSFQDRDRTKVRNVRAYVFSLLKAYDRQVYEDFKATKLVTGLLYKI